MYCVGLQTKDLSLEKSDERKVKSDFWYLLSYIINHISKNTLAQPTKYAKTPVALSSRRDLWDQNIG